MRKMYFSHVPHDQGDDSRPTAARRSPAMKRAAAGRFRGSVAHPAACWEPDTIPKPDGLRAARATANPNGDRAEIERRAALSDLVRGLPLCHHLIDAGALDQAIENDDEGALVLVGEQIDLLVKAVQLRVPNDELGRSVGASSHLVEGDT